MFDRYILGWNYQNCVNSEMIIRSMETQNRGVQFAVERATRESGICGGKGIWQLGIQIFPSTDFLFLNLFTPSFISCTLLGKFLLSLN